MAQRLNVEDLVQRATAGHKFNRHRLFRPSLSYYLVNDPFWLWCEHHAPKDAAVDETTRYEKLRMQRGIDFEARWVREHYPNAIEIKPGFGFAALKNTFKAMLDGARAIYQPQLWDLKEQIYGKGDLLVRDDSVPSELGPYHYRVVEIKRSANLQRSHRLQASFYSYNLRTLQGYLPSSQSIVLRDAIESVPVLDEVFEIEPARKLWRDILDDNVIPGFKRPPNASSSPWRHYANRCAYESKDLVLLAGIPKRDREKLRAAGITNIDQVAQNPQAALNELLGDHYGAIAYGISQAYHQQQPILKPGQALDIPRAKRRLYFDFETSDGVHPTEPPHTYLIGCYDASRDQFVKFLARGAESEERIFSDFVDFIGDLRDVVLYHWTDFEIGQLQRVIRRWPQLSSSLEQIIAHCVDLKTIIQDAVYLPVPTYSIKSVAPALGFHWRQKDIGAYQSMVCYWDYLDNKDLFAIDRAITYNEDDCMAMWHVDQALSRLLGG